MGAAPPQRRHWLPIVAFWAAIAAALALRTALQWGSVPLLGDSDDAMRMVTATDLLEGQSWQDPVQHRDNAPFGAPMHWSRLVDAPLALLIALARPLFGPHAADAVAIAWPLLLLLPMLALSATMIRRLVPDAGTVTALALPMVTFVLVIEFLPGRVDHHNVQILLCLAATLALLTLRDGPAGGIVGAVAVATSLAIGLETVPILVATTAAFACLWLADPSRFRAALAAYGASLALATCGHFLLATAPADYAVATCDMLSITYVVAAALGGFGLTAAALSASHLPRPWQRFAVLAVLGIVALAATAVLFPHCLAGPYAAVDRALPDYFDTIAEAQPLWIRMFTDPPTAAGFALVVILALPVTLWRAWRERGESRIDWLIILGFLAAGALVMVLQLRGARIVAPFALPAAAWVITGARRRYLENGGPKQAALLLGSWLMFASVAHYALAGLGSGWLDARLVRAIENAPISQWQECFIGSHYDLLASLPPGIVMAPSWNGAHILRYTPHAVVSAGFHRNIEGIRAAEAFFSGDEARAREIASARGVSYVAFCPANKKHPTIVGPAAGGHWPWLEPLTAPADILQVYRVTL